MRKVSQEEQLEDITRRPIPKKKVGIVHLQIVKESRVLYGMRRFSTPQEAVDMVWPLLRKADREMVLALSLNTKLEPQALEVVAVGGLNSCVVDIQNIFKHSILNNAAYVVCIHNHPTGDPEPSREDVLLTQKISTAGRILGLPLIDHIIVGEYGFYSFRENGQIEQTLPDDAA